MDANHFRLKRRAAIAAVVSLAVFVLCLGGIQLHRHLRVAALNPRVDVRVLTRHLSTANSPETIEGVLISMMQKRPDLLAAVVVGPDTNAWRGSRRLENRFLVMSSEHVVYLGGEHERRGPVALITVGAPDAKIVATYPRRDSLIDQSLLGPSLLDALPEGAAPPMPPTPAPSVPPPTPGMAGPPPAPAVEATTAPSAASAPAPNIPGSGSRPAWCDQENVACQNCHAGPFLTERQTLETYLSQMTRGRDLDRSSDQLRILHPRVQRALRTALRERDWPNLETEWLSVRLQNNENEATGHLLVLPRPRVGTYTFATYYLGPAAYAGAAVSLLLYLFMLPWWVYLDARPRTEKALPLAIFVGITNFLGWLTYLVIRPEEQRQCPACATLLEPGFRLCPFCGWGAASRCRQCGRAARAEWHFCPYCETPRPQPEVEVHPAPT